jgi:hypothetical protein
MWKKKKWKRKCSKARGSPCQIDGNYLSELLTVKLKLKNLTKKET